MQSYLLAQRYPSQKLLLEEVSGRFRRQKHPNASVNVCDSLYLPWIGVEEVGEVYKRLNLFFRKGANVIVKEGGYRLLYVRTRSRRRFVLYL